MESSLALSRCSQISPSNGGAMFCLARNEDHRISDRGPDTATDNLTACRLDEMSLEHLTNPNRETLLEMGKLRIVAWEASGPRPRVAQRCQG